MLIKLMKYELVKKWKALKFVLLGYILLQVLLLIIIRSFLWNSDTGNVLLGNSHNISVPLGLIMIVYLILTIIIGVLPFFEGLYRFGTDLSGKQSVLELMMPIVSWKKIISKLITALLNTIIGGGLAIISIELFALICSNFDKTIVEGFFRVIGFIFQSPDRFILSSLYIIFCFLSLNMIIFSCIAFSKCFSHKNKIAVPIGIAAFVTFIAAFGFLDIQVQKIPLIKFNLLGTNDSLSSTILGILVFLGTLFGTSWLMENKIEH